MPASFVSLMSAIPDPRIAGMITYPMDEMLLAALVGVVCGARRTLTMWRVSGASF